MIQCDLGEDSIIVSTRRSGTIQFVNKVLQIVARGILQIWMTVSGVVIIRDCILLLAEVVYE